METVMNAYHIKVKVCCASCQHKDVKNDGTRICSKMQLKVPQDRNGYSHHPTPEGHTQYAQLLAEFIKTIR